MSERSTYLHEDLLLLALGRDGGKLPSQSSLPFVLAGAIVAELLLRGRVEVDDDRRKRARVVLDERIGEPVLDACLERMRQRARPATLRTWVTRLAGTSHLKRRIASSLVERRVLRSEDASFLVLFSRTTYFLTDPRHWRAMMGEIKDTVSAPDDDVDPRSVILISLAQRAGLLQKALGREFVRSHKDRIHRLVRGEIVGKATKEAIEAVQVAIMIAVMTPAITNVNRGR